MAGLFKLSKPSSTDLLPPARPHLHRLPHWPLGPIVSAQDYGGHLIQTTAAVEPEAGHQSWHGIPKESGVNNLHKN